MTEIHIDPLGGVAGDMFVAALLDLRPDLEGELREVLASCPLLEQVEIAVEHHNDGILTGHRFSVRRDGKKAEGDAAIHHHDHYHDHNHPHHHDHDTATREHHAGHEHIHWDTIRAALRQSSLDPETIRHAIGIFSRLAEAEAQVHGTTPEEVRFHEVGAWDSIADIVAASWLIVQIGASRWTIGALPLGGGRVKSAHGQLPVPAPAAALLMRGFTTIDDGISGERVTPTGAAIVSYLCEPSVAQPQERILASSAHGFGTRRLPGISNCLRLLAFEHAGGTGAHTESVAILECEIDDQTAEDLAQAIDNLRSHRGVLDIVQAAVFGKKGRMMTQLRVLADVGAQDEIVAMMFDETTTIGIRRSIVQRSTLPRQMQTKDHGGRSLRVKVVERPSGPSAKLESDDLAGLGGHRQRGDLRRLAQDSSKITESKPCR
uniref:LarC family nickel insertion protein n=1 Tax=uncultured Rhizobium sp. TaxID=155567 RepID=UPI0026030CFA|nr:LarC family nickel insertion protein [uncultured Rhizobium sp.]